MNLYDIHQSLINAIEYGVDEETGEILEGQQLADKISEISMAIDDKIENIACYIKNLASDIEALKNEKKVLEQRAKTKENQMEYLKRYLSNFMIMNDIPKFETPKCRISFRKSTSVVIDDETKIPDKYKEIKTEVKIDKAELKKFLKDNICEGAHVEEKSNIGVK